MPMCCSVMWILNWLMRRGELPGDSLEPRTHDGKWDIALPRLLSQWIRLFDLFWCFWTRAPPFRGQWSCRRVQAERPSVAERVYSGPALSQALHNTGAAVRMCLTACFYTRIMSHKHMLGVKEITFRSSFIVFPFYCIFWIGPEGFYVMKDMLDP